MTNQILNYEKFCQEYVVDEQVEASYQAENEDWWVDNWIILTTLIFRYLSYHYKHKRY